MRRSIRRSLIASGLLVAASGASLRGQTAVTVSGHVTSAARPVVGAHVRVDELGIDRPTDQDGRYSFVVPSRSVRGQTVRITVVVTERRLRFMPASASIVLTGGAIEKDFDLVPAGEETVLPSDSARAGAAQRLTPAGPSNVVRLSENIDAEPVDLASALAGRIPGLAVSTASVLGGSAMLTYHGPRSILGSSQPLYVLDGVVLDNTVYTSAAQRFGLGGFDYGSALADIDMANVASVAFVSGADAALRYGSRGANGVVEIHTRTGQDSTGFRIFATVQRTNGSFVRLPELQNQFGQGLGGKFEFFDGRGGGVNDGVDQSWGPALDGRPVSQASYTESGRPDVRLWTGSPDNVRNYFRDAQSTDVVAGLQAHSEYGSFRVALGNRDARGISPTNQQLRRNGSLSATLRPTSRFELATSGFFAETKTDNAPGTGFNEGNPVSQFTRMGRQVNTDSLLRHLRDAAGKQISWNYAGHNNPYFATMEDSNLSRRHHAAGGASGTFAVTSWLKATAQTGVDYFADHRLFSIASGWMGGFPSYAGPGDFSKGGSEGNEIFVQQTNSSLRFDATRALSTTARLTVGVGAETQGIKQRIRTLGVDSVRHVPSAGAPDTAKLPALVNWLGHSRSTAAFGEAGLRFGDVGSIRGGVRQAWSSIVPGQHASSLFPSIQGGIDLARSWAALRNSRVLSNAVLHGAWWRDVNDLTPYSVATMYAGRTPTGSVAPIGSDLLAAVPGLEPEITAAWQVGGDLAFRPMHLGLGVSYYHEQTSGLILPVPNSSVATLLATNAGDVSNSGIEGRMSAQIGDGETGLGWEFSATASHNTNEVGVLYGSVTSLAIAPAQSGLTVEARRGQPLGVLVGRELLRDASGALILRNGLPLPDSVAGPRQLGTAQPTSVLGVRSALRYRWISFDATADGRFGGSVYSATNRFGTFAGTLAGTAVRPDSGLLIVGIDAVSRAANTQHVAAQDYYHALAAVEAPWVYSASFMKLREARITVAIPVAYRLVPFAAANVSLVGRNLYVWTKAPNIDPESVLSTRQVSGLELGQLPTTRTLGFQVSITP